MTEADRTTTTEIEAAVFRRLREHLLQDRPDVQNIDLMNLSGFCRNCLSRWYQEAAAEREQLAAARESYLESFKVLPVEFHEENIKRLPEVEA